MTATGSAHPSLKRVQRIETVAEGGAERSRLRGGATGQGERQAAQWRIS